MARIDPEGTALRTQNILHQREYRVQGPNNLWHIDGNRKLIRWRIVIHGGIDGYSRVPVFLHASDNNHAITVLQSFLNGVQLYDLPSRVWWGKHTSFRVHAEASSTWSRAWKFYNW